MSQEHAWDREYKRQIFLTNENKPQTDVVHFAKFLKKEEKLEIPGLRVLDLGSGTGRNSFYFADFWGAKVTGFEISQTALGIAEANARDASLHITYMKQSIGEKFPFLDNSFDIALDITSSNSLTEKEREVYLSETHRMLNDGGYFFVKALCKESDDNAKYLLKHNPGTEKDTYILPELNIIERVFSREDFETTYKKYFTILYLEKKTTYSMFDGKKYKRNFWICYMKK